MAESESEIRNESKALPKPRLYLLIAPSTQAAKMWCKINGVPSSKQRIIHSERDLSITYAFQDAVIVMLSMWFRNPQLSKSTGEIQKRVKQSGLRVYMTGMQKIEI